MRSKSTQSMTTGQSRHVQKLRKAGWSDAAIAQRREEVECRKAFTSTLHDHGQIEDGVHYACCTDAINVPVIGDTAREAKRKMNLGKNDSIRDHLTPLQNAALRLAEAAASEMIVQTGAVGPTECIAVCAEAGRIVGTTLTAFKAS